MRKSLTDILAALAGASVMTLAMLVGIDGLAQPVPPSTAWAGHYVASTLA